MAKFFLGVLVGMFAVVGLTLLYEQVAFRGNASCDVPFVFPWKPKPPPMQRVDDCDLQRVPDKVIPPPMTREEEVVP